MHTLIVFLGHVDRMYINVYMYIRVCRTLYHNTKTGHVIQLNKQTNTHTHAHTYNAYTKAFIQIYEYTKVLIFVWLCVCVSVYCCTHDAIMSCVCTAPVEEEEVTYKQGDTVR
eukprot:GHVQ01016382.1.p2 GENE.GHVQ01016382.1~~GHVQ01016382.1.p2  ORF type:complete len:113 (-),score=14.17 GHVQ01016382.1:182-520(-)